MDVEASATNFDRILPIVSWIYETLEKATEVADSNMSEKEGLVVLILYKRKGLVRTGSEMEHIFRSWNDAHHSGRALEDLGVALARMLRDKVIDAEGIAESALSKDGMERDAISELRNITLTKEGWFRAGAMRAVIYLRLESAQEKFGGPAQDFWNLLNKLDLPPMMTEEF